MRGSKEDPLPDTSTIRLNIRTGTDDRNGLLMLLDGELVAILIELGDAVHEEACGRWALEMSFGIDDDRSPETFASIEQAWDWVNRMASGEHWPVVNGSRASI